MTNSMVSGKRVPTANPDGAGARFVAEEPWVATRPNTLVVFCSDGRWHAQVEEFVRDQISDRADSYVVPGGPAGFNLWSSSFDEARVAEKSFRFLADHHDLESVWLIAHQQCAYYRVKYGPLDEPYMYRRQHEDMERVSEQICRWYPKLVIRQAYAALEDGRVVFTRCDKYSRSSEKQ
jgi:hypothetical protein